MTQAELEAYCKGIEDFVSDVVHGLPFVWKESMIQRGRFKIQQAIEKNGSASK